MYEVMRTGNSDVPEPKAPNVMSYLIHKDGTVTQDSQVLEAGGIVDPL